MKTFKDAQGREWKIAINIGAAKRIREKLDGADMLQPEVGDHPFLTRIGTDIAFLAEVLCELLIDQFEANGVTEQMMGDVFDGEVLIAAQMALYEDLVNFFQALGRIDRASAVTKQMAIQKAAFRMGSEKIENLNAETEVAKVFDRIDGKMSGDSPESSDSSPTA